MAATEEVKREVNALQIALAKTQSDLNTVESSISNKIDTQTVNMNLVVNEAKAAFDQVAQEVLNTQSNITNLAGKPKRLQRRPSGRRKVSKVW